MHRRTFIVASTGTSLAASPLLAVGSRIGMSDVSRFGQAFDQLIHADNTKGGNDRTERLALGHAEQILRIQQTSSASQRVRSRMYFFAAAFTSTAMWAAVDSRQSVRAQRHLEKAIMVAGLSGDPRIQHRIWGHAAMLATQQKRYADAIASAEAARQLGISRRDPLFGSLAHARAAGAYSEVGQKEAALRSLGHAELAFARVDRSEPRPTWMGFYDRAELEGLSGLVHLGLGHYSRAEACFHGTLAMLKPEMARNQAYYTAKLAHAQLRQGDADQACATASAAAGGPAGSSGRVSKLIDSFGRELVAAAPGAKCTREWTSHHPLRRAT